MKRVILGGDMSIKSIADEITTLTWCLGCYGENWKPCIFLLVKMEGDIFSEILPGCKNVDLSNHFRLTHFWQEFCICLWQFLTFVLSLAGHEYAKDNLEYAQALEPENAAITVSLHTLWNFVQDIFTVEDRIIVYTIIRIVYSDVYHMPFYFTLYLPDLDLICNTVV